MSTYPISDAGRGLFVNEAGNVGLTTLPHQWYVKAAVADTDLCAPNIGESTTFARDHLESHQWDVSIIREGDTVTDKNGTRGDVTNTSTTDIHVVTRLISGATRAENEQKLDKFQGLEYAGMGLTVDDAGYVTHETVAQQWLIRNTQILPVIGQTTTVRLDNLAAISKTADKPRECDRVTDHAGSSGYIVSILDRELCRVQTQEMSGGGGGGGGQNKWFMSVTNEFNPGINYITIEKSSPGTPYIFDAWGLRLDDWSVIQPTDQLYIVDFPYGNHVYLKGIFYLLDSTPDSLGGQIILTKADWDIDDFTGWWKITSDYILPQTVGQTFEEANQITFAPVSVPDTVTIPRVNDFLIDAQGTTAWITKSQNSGGILGGTTLSSGTGGPDGGNKKWFLSVTPAFNPASGAVTISKTTPGVIYILDAARMQPLDDWSEVKSADQFYVIDYPSGHYVYLKGVMLIGSSTSDSVYGQICLTKADWEIDNFTGWWRITSDYTLPTTLWATFDNDNIPTTPMTVPVGVTYPRINDFIMDAQGTVAWVQTQRNLGTSLGGTIILVNGGEMPSPGTDFKKWRLTVDKGYNWGSGNITINKGGSGVVGIFDDIDTPLLDWSVIKAADLVYVTEGPGTYMHPALRGFFKLNASAISSITGQILLAKADWDAPVAVTSTATVGQYADAKSTYDVIQSSKPVPVAITSSATTGQFGDAKSTYDAIQAGISESGRVTYYLHVLDSFAWTGAAQTITKSNDVFIVDPADSQELDDWSVITEGDPILVITRPASGDPRKLAGMLDTISFTTNTVRGYFRACKVAAPVAVASSATTGQYADAKSAYDVIIANKPTPVAITSSATTGQFGDAKSTYDVIQSSKPVPVAITSSATTGQFADAKSTFDAIQAGGGGGTGNFVYVSPGSYTITPVLNTTNLTADVRLYWQPASKLCRIEYYCTNASSVPNVQATPYIISYNAGVFARPRATGMSALLLEMDSNGTSSTDFMNLRVLQNETPPGSLYLVPQTGPLDIGDVFSGSIMYCGE